MNFSTIRRLHDAVEETLPTIFFFAIFLTMCVGVLFRYVFRLSFAWNVEFSLFVGSAKVRKTNSHIKIDVVYGVLERRMSPTLRMVCWLFKEAVIVVFLVLLVFLSYELALRSWAFRSQAMQWRQSYLYISVAVGAGMFLLREIPDAVRTFRQGFEEPLTVLEFSSEIIHE
jgi:TRAP-type C4-dicarboxylate transport system permease small subunit